MDVNTQEGATQVKLPWPARALSPNVRVHWSVEAKAKKKYRRDCYYATRAAKASASASESVTLSFTFYPPHNRGYDKDNLIAQMKSGIDGIADALGIDDKHFHLGAVELGERIEGGVVRVLIVENKEQVQ